MDALDVPSYMKGLAEKLGLPYPTLAEWKASKAAPASAPGSNFYDSKEAFTGAPSAAPASAP